MTHNEMPVDFAKREPVFLFSRLSFCCFRRRDRYLIVEVSETRHAL